MFIYPKHHNTKIASAALPVLLIAPLLLAQNASDTSTQNSQSSATGTSNQSSTDKRPLERVRARKLDGFELSSKSSGSATQVAGASRSFGTDTTLLAPHK